MTDDRRVAAAVAALIHLAEPKMKRLAVWLERRRALVMRVLAEVLAAEASAGERAPRRPGWDNLPAIEAADEWTRARRREANVKALLLLAELAGERPDAEQRKILARYSGWGGAIVDEEDVKRVPESVRPKSWRGLVDEYYTPTKVCQSAWRLLRRLVRRGYLAEDPDALEPAAGIGRFIRTGPQHIRWRAVELASEAAALLRALEPELLLYEGPFQAFMRDFSVPVGGDVDLVLANPPYAAQGRYLGLEGRAGKYDGKEWPKAEQYFLHAASRRLRPGGVMAQLVPLGVMTGPKASMRLREALLLRCHFLGAYALPGDLFSGAMMGLSIVLFQARERVLSEVSPSDREVLEGRYFKTEDGKENQGGRWMSDIARETGKRFWREMIVATDDARPLEEMLLRLPERAPAPPKEVKPKAAAAEKPKAKPKKTARPDMGLPCVRRAAALGKRVIRQRELKRSDPALAEAARAELLADVEGWIGEYGSPHESPRIVPGALAELDAFLSVASESGELAPLLSEGAAESKVSGFLGDRRDLAQVVRHLSGRYGEAAWADVVRIFTGSRDAEDALSGDVPPSVMVELAEGRLVLYDRREYLSGDLYERLDQVEAALRDEGVPKWLGSLAERQRRLLIKVIDPKSIEAIDVDFRSGLVSEECLSQWLTEKNDGSPITARWMDGLLVLDGARISTEVEDIAAFASRQDLYARRGEGKKSRRHKSDATLQQKMIADKQLAEDFLSWVRAHEAWGPHLADVYNRRFRARVPRPEDEAPLQLARAQLRLRRHQTVSVRALTEARGGIVAHDVGLGKTFGGLGLIAYWRQKGMTRRPIVVVPKQVITNWLREAKRLLPDYDVGAIGVTWDPKKKRYREDKPADKRIKWQRFASGTYDLLVVTQPAFEELPTRPDTFFEVLSRQTWLRREEHLANNEQGFLRRRIEHLEGELAGDLTTKQSDGIERSLQSARDQLQKAQDRLGYLEDQVARAKRELENASGKDKKQLSAKLGRLQKQLQREKKTPTLRQLEAAREKWEQWTRKTEFERQKDLGLTWEDLGCDLLVVDEGHAYKNLFRPESRYGQPVKFLGSSGGRECKRCWDMLVKTTLLRDQYAGTGVVFLTATPLKNSPLEFYSLMQYVRPEVFTDRGIRTHEEFVDRYCGFTQRYILDATQNLKEYPVVERFDNLDELRQIMDLYVDFKDADDVGLEVPEAITEQVTVPMTKAQEEVYEDLRKEGQAAISSPGQGGGPNILSVLQRMGFAALDLRLIDPATYAGFSPPKYEALAERVLAGKGCAHIIFMSESRLESIDYCVDALANAGIDRARIVTMHGGVKQGERQELVDGLNGVFETKNGKEVMVSAPRYDVIVGNQVMSEGLNLQRRACSIHHLDLPWTPSDIQQRNGRGVRQGNRYAEKTGQPVRLYYYLTERSSDGYRLQTISGKRGWIHTLVKSSQTSANNPLADSEFDELDLITMFASDPEDAKERIKKRKAQMEAERKADLQNDANKRFSSYVALHHRARRHDDPQMAKRFRRQADQVGRYLKAYPDDVFAPKDLLEVAKSKPLYWDGGELVLYVGEGFSAVDEGFRRRYVVEVIDPAKKLLAARRLGQFPVRTLSFETLEALAPKAAEWSASDDQELLEQAADRYFSAGDLPLVPDRLLERYGERLWRSVYGWGGGPEAIPFVVRGEVVVMKLKDALEHKETRVPILPTADGWAEFLATPGGSQNQRRLVARRWFRRTYPETSPASEAPPTQIAA